VQLVEIFLLAAINSAKNLEYVAKIQTVLENHEQVEIMKIISKVDYRHPICLDPANGGSVDHAHITGDCAECH
jgi:hypothetical protein